VKDDLTFATRLAPGWIILALQAGFRTRSHTGYSLFILWLFTQATRSESRFSTTPRLLDSVNKLTVVLTIDTKRE
jgi:hypothetical protein